MRAITLMLKTLWSPGAAFAEIREARIGPWVPIAVTIAFGLLNTFLLTNRVDVGDALMREFMRNPQVSNMSAEQLAEMRQGMEQGAPLIRAAFYGIAVAFPFASVIVAGLYFGIFLVLGSRSGFMSFWATTAFAFTPMMIGSIASIGVMYTIPPAAMQLGQLNVLSPAVFLDPNVEAGAIYALAQALSLTTIWTLCLLIIGYGVVGTKRSSTTLRSVVVVTPWLLTVALRVLPALLF